MTPSLTLFFIVEPPSYQYLACYLAASIRNHLPASVKLLGYCPQHRRADLDPAAVETLRRMNCEVRFFDAEGKFDPPYPHGNKILACLEPRETDFSGFVDSDVLMIRDNSVENLLRAGHVSASPAASMRWAGQEIWSRLYGAFGMAVPKDRILLMRDKREDVVPYFSSGFVLFPEQHRTAEGKGFAQVWYETARQIDAIPDLDNKRPYLDQMSLPIAIARAGLRWNELPEEQHFILGGSIRGKPLPTDRPIYTVHYRKWDVLKEAGLAAQGYDGLRRQVGTSRVKWIFSQPAPEARRKITARPVRAEPMQKTTLAGAPDPSKAPMAAVTMVYQDHFFLERWVRYYSEQIGRENLYILRHGADPEIDRIAEGANIIHVPNLPDKSRLDRERWGMLSQFASGLTLYHNWVLTNDVDEIVALDPAIGHSLPNYLNNLFENGAPQVISPFAVEIIHTPASEKDPILPDYRILERRRNFRINSNYAKPCLIRNRIRFSVGGHGSNIQDVTLDPNLYLFHLRYVDDVISRQRLAARRELELGRGSGEALRDGTWAKSLAAYETLCTGQPVAERSSFPEITDMMIDGRTQAATGNWFFKTYRSKELYRLPERFSKLF